MASYFDVKRELKKTYEKGVGAIRRLDARYINSLLSILNTLKTDIEADNDINAMGKQVLKKEIKHLLYLLPSKLKQAEETNEQKSRKHTSSRNEDNSINSKPKPV